MIAKLRDYISNECWRVITLHALIEICEILQIEKSISISRQTLTYVGRDTVTVHFLPESQYPGKVIYKPSVLDEKQLHLKQDRSRSHKSAV